MSRFTFSTEVSVSDFEAAVALTQTFHSLNIDVQRERQLDSSRLFKHYTELKMLSEFLQTYDEKVLQKMDNPETQKKIAQAETLAKTTELSKVVSTMPSERPLESLMSAENLQVAQSKFGDDK